jgi:chromatin segregation and condensation protein Rec8/ScpA/Scc1 (kleisin family)
LGLFLATLELIKGRQIVVEQPEAFGDVYLALPEPEPAESPEAAEPPGGQE